VKQKLLQSNGKQGTKSEFSRMASAIGKDISTTTIKLGKLAQRQLLSLRCVRTEANWTIVAKRKTLFDDRPVEISVCLMFIVLRTARLLNFIVKELTFIIKQDIAHINKQIAALQSYVKQRNAQGSKSVEGKQIDEHNHNVVMLLQSKLATTSMTFKDVLEVRTQVCRGARVWCLSLILNLHQNMKESKDRTEQFMYSTASAANQAPSSQYTRCSTILMLNAFGISRFGAI
jgi:syntaxin 5